MTNSVIELDSLAPKRMLSLLERGERWYHPYSMWNSPKRIGIPIKRMLDWRGLERRAATTHNRAVEFNRMHTKNLDALIKKAQKSGLIDVILWPTTTAESEDSWYKIVDKHDKDSLRMFEISFNEMFNEVKTNSTPKHMTLPNELSQRLKWEDHISYRLWMLSNMYLRTFHDAVDDRISSLLEGMTWQQRDTTNQILIVENDDRRHIAIVEGHKPIRWLPGTVTLMC